MVSKIQCDNCGGQMQKMGHDNDRKSGRSWVHNYWCEDCGAIAHVQTVLPSAIRYEDELPPSNVMTEEKARQE